MTPRPTGRPVTIKDVAREAAVSTASASRALNGSAKVADGLRDRVLGAAQRLRYVPHVGARSLSTRRTDLVGVVLPDIYGEFFSELIRGMDGAARTRGLHLLVSNSHGDATEAAAALRAMRGRVDGVILMSPYVDADVLADNLADDLPAVLINTRAGGGRAAFRVDNDAGARMVTEHLLASGRRRIAHVAGPDGNLEADERRRGYQDAMAAAGLEPWVHPGDFTEEGGAAAARAFAAMTEPPDAVFAANDMTAVGCLLALEAAGLRAPEDMAVAGFDDVPAARLVRPALTTARVNIAELGRRAFERLAREIAGAAPDAARPETLRPELVVRASSTPQESKIATGRF